MDKVKHQLTETSLLYDANQNEEEDNHNEMVAQVKQQLDNFEVALLDDLSMPRAAASLFGVVKLAEAEFKKNNNQEATTVPLNVAGLAAVHDAMNQMDRVFGIFYQVPDDEEPTEEVDAGVPEQVMELVEERTAAKEAKDWDLADSLRARITELGFAVKDVKGGDPLVSRID
jgi:cysteinyl-tRNA synthetase